MVDYTSKAKLAEAAKAEQEAQAKEGAEAQAVAEVAASAGVFVKMFKDGGTIDVHPTTVDSHLQAGWRVHA